LIFERSEAEKRGPTAIRRIEGAIAESEKCAQGAPGKCAKEKIERDGPARPTRFGGKRLDDGPPEEDRGEEEAGVFDFVPGIGAESKFKCGRNVPSNESDCGEDPADEGVGEKFSERLHRAQTQERAERSAHEPLWESVKKRQGGSAEKDERRNDKHKKDVLDHVDGEGGFIEGRERRADGDPEGEHSGEKSGETPWREKIEGGAAEREPAAKIEKRGEADNHVENNGRRPFVQDGFGFRRHGS